MKPTADHKVPPAIFIQPWSHPARWQFILLWMILHSLSFFALGISTVMWIVGFTAPCILIGLYTLLMYRTLPKAHRWGCTTWIGSMSGVLVSSQIDLDRVLLSIIIIGFGVGVATLPLIPWQGRRTLVWPVSTTLGAMGAAGLVVWWGDQQSLGSMLGMLFPGGACYGLLTGPILYHVLFPHQRAA